MNRSIAVPQRIIGMLLCGILATPVMAYPNDESTWGVTASWGHGTRYITSYRVSASKTYGPIWLEDWPWQVHLIWENSLAHWKGDAGPTPNSPTSLNIVTSGPMFRFQKATPIMGVLPYIEGGIGLSLMSETEISGRKMSLNFQFEDKAGIGMRFGPEHRLDASVRLAHYSNGSLKMPNSGVNMYLVSLGFWFPTK